MDPFTIANLVGSGLGFITQQKNLKSQQAQMNQMLNQGASQEKAALKGLKDTTYSVAPAYREMLMMSKQDPMADALRQQAASQEAANVSALKSGGARALLGGLGGVANQAAMNLRDIEAESFGRRQKALQTFGSQQQAAMNKNIADQRGLLEQQYGRSQALQDMARSSARQLQGLSAQNISNAFTKGIPLLQETFGIGGGGLENLFNR